MRGLRIQCEDGVLSMYCDGVANGSHVQFDVMVICGRHVLLGTMVIVVVMCRWVLW